MAFNPDKHHRRSIRLGGYDYSQLGAYFVTIVTKNRAYLFGEIVDDEMQLNRAGQIAQLEWMRLGRRFPNVHLGTFVVMPNHIHAILIIHADVGATLPGRTRNLTSKNRAPAESLSDNSGSPLPDYNGRTIGQFKSRVTKRLWTLPGLSGTSVWQRNYHERIIRNDTEWNNVRNYILNNPMNWKNDKEFNDKSG